MYDASNRKDVRRAEKAQAIADRSRINYLVAAMSTVQGREWFLDLLEFCHLFSDPFSGDALREAYLKGERNVGLRIFADILLHCPDQYVQMMREANARRIEKESADARRTAAEQSRSQNGNGGVEGAYYDPYDIHPGDETAGNET